MFRWMTSAAAPGEYAFLTFLLTADCRSDLAAGFQLLFRNVTFHAGAT
jgi:hypothetical protein